MELFTVGIDLGKTKFHLVGMNQRGEVVVRKRFSRTQLLHFTGVSNNLGVVSLRLITQILGLGLIGRPGSSASEP
jgi:hypothetical protein